MQLPPETETTSISWRNLLEETCLKKIREIDWGHAYTCNNFTSFKCKVKCNPHRKRNVCSISWRNLLEEKIREIATSEFILWRILHIWYHCASAPHWDLRLSSVLSFGTETSTPQASLLVRQSLLKFSEWSSSPSFQDF